MYNKIAIATVLSIALSTSTNAAQVTRYAPGNKCIYVQTTDEPDVDYVIPYPPNGTIDNRYEAWREATLAAWASRTRNFTFTPGPAYSDCWGAKTLTGPDLRN